MEIKHIRGNTFYIDTGMSSLPFYKVNDEEIIMLDTGWAEGERAGIEALLEANHYKVSGIICSHSHIDHVGNNAYFKQKYNSTIAMSSYCAHVCASKVNLKVYYSNQNLTDVAEHFGHMVCETDIMITDEQTKIYVCGIKFKIRHTPGHSPSHICIITPDDVAYLGDCLIGYEVMNGAKMPYAFILREDLKSKEKLHELKCSKYIVSHKGVFDDITDLITDNINFYKLRAEKVCDVIKGSMTMEEIMKEIMIVFHIRVQTTHRYAVIERMLRSFIEYLNETGAVEANIEDGFLKYRRIRKL